MAAQRGGSPPRGWGKLFGVQIPELYHRFTPTRVGKTAEALLLVGDLAVHPHAGGENGQGEGGRSRGERFTPTRVGKTMPVSDEPTLLSGSPPRGWGKLSRRSTH